MNSITENLTISYNKDDKGEYTHIKLSYATPCEHSNNIINIINRELALAYMFRTQLSYLFNQKNEMQNIQDLEMIRNEYNHEIQKIRQELIEKNKCIDSLKQIHEEELNMSKIKFTQSITNLNSSLDLRVSNEIRHVEEKFKLKEQFYQSTIQDMKEHMEQLNKIHQENEIILNVLKQPKMSIDIGNHGEQFIQSVLHQFIQYNTNAKLEDVSGQSSSGDLRFIYHSMRCCIEVKNIKESIGESHIDKFYRDVQDLKNNYNCGVLISIRSGFTIRSNIDDMEVKIIDNKPVIFLSNIDKNRDKIIMAIQVLHRIVNLLSTNQTYEAFHFIDQFKYQLQQLSLIENQLKIIKQSTKSMEVAIQQSKKNIHDTLQLDEYSHTQVQSIQTPCGKVYKGITKNYKNHIETCISCKSIKLENIEL